MYYTVAYQIYTGINYFLDIITAILFIYCLMTWFVRPNSQMFVFMRRMVEPIVAPFRPLAMRLMEKGLMLDISVLLAMFAIRILRYILSIIFFRFIL